MIRLLRLPAMLLLALVVAFFVSCAASAQAQPQGAPQPNSTVAPPASIPSGGQSNETGVQPEANPTGAQPESSPTRGQHVPQDAQGESQSGRSESGSSSQEPASQIIITIDKTSQQMTVWVDGIEQYKWPVSTGRSGYSTPSGTYTPTSMNEVWYSKQWDNSPMPHSIFFMKDGHAIHGSYEVKSLGKPVSHGCVRISPANAAILYALVKERGLENAQVVLTGTTPGGEATMASQPSYRRYESTPWFAPGQDYRPAPRRGFFGQWFQPSYGRWFRP